MSVRHLHTGGPPLELLETSVDGRTRLQLVGELDIATVGAVGERLARLSERHQAVVLDLDELTFIDAKGARLVVEAAESARRDGWSFAITPGSRPVRRLFQLLEVADTLPYDGELTP